MFQIGNLYLITAIAVTGGGLFGFDIASMSAILGESQYKCYFNQGDEPCVGLARMCKEASRLPCREVHGSALSFLVLWPTYWADAKRLCWGPSSGTDPSCLKR